MQQEHDKYIDPLKLIKSAGFTSAIIAGGAFRDLYHGIEPKDVDIFVWDPISSDESPAFPIAEKYVVNNYNNCVHAWTNILQLGDEDTVTLIFGSYYSPYHKNTAVWDIWKNGLNIQVIFTKIPPIEHMHLNFDIGLCKCYHDGQNIHYTDDFLTDANNKTLTIVAQDMTECEYSTTTTVHIPALQKKYPYPIKYNHSMLVTETVAIPFPTPI